MNYVPWDNLTKAQLRVEAGLLVGPRPLKTSNISHAELEARKDATKHLDYGCASCPHARAEKQTLEKQQRCCTRCSKTFGYLEEHRISKKHLQQLLEYYDKKLGFWRPKIGCILPRSLRSLTCLTYSCYMKYEERAELRSYLYGESGAMLQLPLPLQGARTYPPEEVYHRGRGLKMYWQKALS